MKYHKYEVAVVAITLAFICFVAGFFVGRSRQKGVITITTQEKTDVVLDEDAEKTENSEEITSDGLININTANKAVLSELEGIGEELAGRIIAYRTENSEFESIYEIMEVPGIGEGKFAAIKEYISVGEAEQ